MLLPSRAAANDVSALAAADPKNLAYVYNQVNPAGYKALNVSWWLGPSASGASPTASGVFLTDGARDVRFSTSLVRHVVP